LQNCFWIATFADIHLNIQTFSLIPSLITECFFLIKLILDASQ